MSKSAVRDTAVWTALTGGGAMASWVLVASLVALRSQINQLAPNRDKATDGSIGNEAHADSVSDHNPDETGNTGGVEDSDSINEVHAIDVDKTGPWPAGVSMERIVQHLVREHKAGRDNRLRYIIYNRRIWSASNGWNEAPYTGSNAHTEHAHFSARYGSGSGTSNPENDTSDYGLTILLEVEVATLDSDDKAWLKSAEFTTAVANAVFARKVNTEHPSFPTRSFGSHVNDMQNLRDAFVHALDDARIQGRPLAGSGFDFLVKGVDRMVATVQAASAAELERDAANVAALLAAVSEVGGSGPITDEQLREALRVVYGEAFTRAEAQG